MRYIFYYRTHYYSKSILNKSVSIEQIFQPDRHIFLNNLLIFQHIQQLLLTNITIFNHTIGKTINNYLLRGQILTQLIYINK